MNIQKVPNKHLKTTFLWKDQHDNYHNVTDMATSHIFYTLRMIWNHSAPEKYKLKPYKRYNFSPFYTQSYIKEAIVELIQELKTRENIEIYIPQLIRIQKSIEEMQWQNYRLIQD